MWEYEVRAYCRNKKAAITIAAFLKGVSVKLNPYRIFLISYVMYRG